MANRSERPQRNETTELEERSVAEISEKATEGDWRILPRGASINVDLSPKDTPVTVSMAGGSKARGESPDTLYVQALDESVLGSRFVVSYRRPYDHQVDQPLLLVGGKYPLWKEIGRHTTPELGLSDFWSKRGLIISDNLGELTILNRHSVTNRPFVVAPEGKIVGYDDPLRSQRDKMEQTDEHDPVERFWRPGRTV